MAHKLIAAACSQAVRPLGSCERHRQKPKLLLVIFRAALAGCGGFGSASGLRFGLHQAGGPGQARPHPHDARIRRSGKSGEGGEYVTDRYPIPQNEKTPFSCHWANKFTVRGVPPRTARCDPRRERWRESLSETRPVRHERIQSQTLAQAAATLSLSLSTAAAYSPSPPSPSLSSPSPVRYVPSIRSEQSSQPLASKPACTSSRV